MTQKYEDKWIKEFLYDVSKETYKEEQEREEEERKEEERKEEERKEQEEQERKEQEEQEELKKKGKIPQKDQTFKDESKIKLRNEWDI